MQPTPRVAVIIVHWRNMDDTIECLGSLARVPYPAMDIVLVSTGSPDFDREQIATLFPAVTVIPLAENLGFAGANNVGIRHALAHGADFVLLLNPDTIVAPQLISALLPAAQLPGVGIVGPVITYYDRPDTVWFAGGRHSKLLGYSLHPGMGKPLTTPITDRDVDFINGCTMLISRAALDHVGGISEAFFMYFEDFEFCLRAAQAGYRCRLVGEPLVQHKVSSSAGQRGSNAMTPGKAYYFGRNPFLVLRRTARGLWALTGLVSQFLVVLPFHTLLAARAGQLAAMLPYLAGMRAGMRGETGVWPTLANTNRDRQTQHGAQSS